MPQHNTAQPRAGQKSRPKSEGKDDGKDRGDRGDRSGKSSRNGAGRPPLTRDVMVSKKVSYILRHGAKKEGLNIDERGFVNCEDLVSRAASLCSSSCFSPMGVYDILKG